MNDDPDREISIFTAALKIPRQDRGEFLGVVCAGDEGLRKKVEALLRTHERMGNFLEEPPAGHSDD